MKKSSGPPPPLRCAHCGKAAGPAGEKLVQCTACRQVRYCGKQCQTAHWRAAHQAQCKQFRKLSAVAAKNKLLAGKGLQQSPPSAAVPITIRLTATVGVCWVTVRTAACSPIDAK